MGLITFLGIIVSRE